MPNDSPYPVSGLGAATRRLTTIAISSNILNKCLRRTYAFPHPAHRMDYPLREGNLLNEVKKLTGKQPGDGVAILP